MPASQPPLFSKDSIYRPQNYGTIDPTGSADSSTAIQAALTACAGSLYGGIVEIPPGRFKIGTALDFGQPTYDSPHGWGYQFGRQLQGAGKGATTLVAGSGLTSPVLTVRGTTAGLPSVTIRDIGFNGNAETGLTAGVVKLFAVAFAHIENVQVLGATGGTTLAPLGLNLSDCLTYLVDHVHVANCGTGIKTQSAGSYGTNQLSFRDLVVAGTTTWAVDLSGGLNVLIQGLDVEGGTGGVVRFSGGGQFVCRGPVWIEETTSGDYTTLFDITASYAKIEPPLEIETTVTNAIQNRSTTVLTVENWRTSATCVNASGATLNKINSNLTGSGGTTNTWH